MIIKQWYHDIISHDYEQEKLLALVKKFVAPGARILDVGCGYGRYLIPLKARGYHILGIDQNAEIVNENRQKGLDCLLAEKLQEQSTPFNLIILSHIIEHFSPKELLSFLDEYLSKLENDGYLIIATPLYSHSFYEDFDHVKPYHPVGLQMVFGNHQAQVQYYSKNKIILRDIWFRKSPYFTVFQRAKYLKTPMTRFIQCYDLFMSLLFKMSFGMIGKKDGWIGVFQKIKTI